MNQLGSDGAKSLFPHQEGLMFMRQMRGQHVDPEAETVMGTDQYVRLVVRAWTVGACVEDNTCRVLTCISCVDMY
jgi:hypothetical protein